jgi:hypothetical protein
MMQSARCAPAEHPRAEAWLLADKLSQQTGVEIIAARDGLEFPLPGPADASE